MYNKPNGYLRDAIITASPTSRLLMLLDRLTTDLKHAQLAFESNNIELRNSALIHAQEIVLSLRDSLRVDLWSGAEQLSRIYGFIYSELVFANVNSDYDRFRLAEKLLSQIIDSWRNAAKKLETQGALVGLG